MNMHEIIRKLKSGEMILDAAGHQTNDTLSRFIKRYEDSVELSNGSNDGKWTLLEGTTLEETDREMREFHQLRLNYDIKDEDSLCGLFPETCCFGCGETLRWVLTGKKLQLREHAVQDEKAAFGVALVNYPKDYICPFAAPQSTRGEIMVEGPLIIANFFREGKIHS